MVEDNKVEKKVEKKVATTVDDKVEEERVVGNLKENMHRYVVSEHHQCCNLNMKFVVMCALDLNMCRQYR